MSIEQCVCHTRLQWGHIAIPDSTQSPRHSCFVTSLPCLIYLGFVAFIDSLTKWVGISEMTKEFHAKSRDQKEGGSLLITFIHPSGIDHMPFTCWHLLHRVYLMSVLPPRGGRASCPLVPWILTTAWEGGWSHPHLTFTERCIEFAKAIHCGS